MPWNEVNNIKIRGRKKCVRILMYARVTKSTTTKTTTPPPPSQKCRQTSAKKKTRYISFERMQISSGRMSKTNSLGHMRTATNCIILFYIWNASKKEATRIVENRHMPLALLLLCQLLDNTLDSFSLPLSAFQRPFAIRFLSFWIITGKLFTRIF